MNSGSLNERITRALAFMLRHQPEEFDLELDRFGRGDLEEVLYALQERMGATVDEDDVLAAIEASDRPRYEVEDGRIRALYGHSFPIDPGEASEPPDELFIGVGSRDAERAEDRGLRSGRRAFLHLARTEEEARESGRRVARDYAVVTVYAGEAFDEGIEFYDRGALYLADEIPTEFLEVGDIQHDGIDRDEGRRSRGRRTADGPRGPRRQRRDRDDDRGEGRRPSRDDEPRGRREPRSEEDRPAAKSEPKPEPRREREETPKRQPARDEPEAAPASSFGSGLVGGSKPAAESRSEEHVIEPAKPKREARSASQDSRSGDSGSGSSGARESGSKEPEREVDVPRREAETPPPTSGFGAGIE